MYYCNSEKEPKKLNYKDITRLIKVCDGYDDLSEVKYNELIENTKHLDFYKYIDRYHPQDQGSLIRWLYRGLSLNQAIAKIEYKLENSFRFSRNWYGNGTFSPYYNRNTI